MNEEFSSPTQHFDSLASEPLASDLRACESRASDVRAAGERCAGQFAVEDRRLGSPLASQQLAGQQLAGQQGPSLVSLNLVRLWERCLQRIRPQIEAHIFNAYLASLKFVAFDSQTRRCTVTAPSRFVSNYVDQHIKTSLEELLGSVFSSALNCAAGPLALAIEVEAPKTEKTEPIWIARGEAAIRHGAQNGPGELQSNIELARDAGENAARGDGANCTTGLFSNGLFSTSGSGGRDDSGGRGTQRAPAQFSRSQAQGQAMPHATRSAQFNSQRSSNSQRSNSHLEHEIHRSFLSSRYTFDNFVVGNNSQFVHAAALQISEQPGQRYNPLFIYGGVGLGKTHLLHAIGNALVANNPAARVLYLSSETFTNELIAALRVGRMDEFKVRLRTIDLLLIDDIQFISGKERTQEEFFHTFNALYSARKQIILTADKMPQDMPGIEERLQTRFTWGLAADLQAPDFETRVAIVTKKCAADGIELAPEIAHFIADKVSSNVRELEGALTRLQAYASLQKRAIDLSIAELALRPFTQKRVVTLSSADIKRAVATHFGVRTSEMVSKTRTRSISFPRHVAMFLCRKHTTLSYPEIGGEFGGRDHSSVIHAANVVSGKIQSDQEIRKIVQEIENHLMAGS